MMRWEQLPYGQNGQFLDVSGVGRYIIRPEAPRSRQWHAFLNGKRTSFFAIGGEKVKIMVERAIRATQLERNEE